MSYEKGDFLSPPLKMELNMTAYVDELYVAVLYPVHR